MTKKPEETCNEWIFRKYRSQSEANFQKFLDKFFEKGTNKQDYEDCINKKTDPKPTPEEPIKDVTTQKSNKTNYLF